MNKVIGIGLPRTGTRSLTKILNNNAIKTVHFGDAGCAEIAEKVVKGIYQYDVLRNYQGITNAFDTVYPQIDKSYPGSKFIHTIRDKESWLISIEKHLKESIDKGNDQELVHNHLITFGSYYFNPDRFSYVYDTHLLLVNEYFKDRPNDILTVNITKDKDCVKKICDFLHIPMKNNTWERINFKI